jgi:hypothetical protein
LFSIKNLDFFGINVFFYGKDWKKKPSCGWWLQGRDFGNDLVFIWSNCHQREGRELKENYAETKRQPDMVSVETQTGSEFPDLLTCTTLHSNNLQNSSTHNA